MNHVTDADERLKIESHKPNTLLLIPKYFWCLCFHRQYRQYTSQQWMSKDQDMVYEELKCARCGQRDIKIRRLFPDSP